MTTATLSWTGPASGTSSACKPSRIRSGDGNAALVARLNGPRGIATAPDISDQGNQHIRRVTLSDFQGPLTIGLMKFKVSSDDAQKRPIISATLTLKARRADLQKPPNVAVVSPYLKNTSTVWTKDNFTQTGAPEINLAGGIATPTSPALDSQGRWNLAVGDNVKFSIPPGAFPTGVVGSDANDFIFLGMVAPDDGTDYYYATSQGVPSDAKRAFAFDTPLTPSGTKPSLNVIYAGTYITRPIMSPPSIWYNDSHRYVFLSNGNSLFRYTADGNAPSSFSASVDFSYGRAMRYNASTYKESSTTSFVANAAPPLINYDGRVHMLDYYMQNTSKASFALNAFNGAANDASGVTHIYKEIAPFTNNSGDWVDATVDDNVATYMVGDIGLTDNTYFGLSNGRIYRMNIE